MAGDCLLVIGEGSAQPLYFLLQRVLAVFLLLLYLLDQGLQVGDLSFEGLLILLSLPLVLLDLLLLSHRVPDRLPNLALQLGLRLRDLPLELSAFLLPLF